MNFRMVSRSFLTASVLAMVAVGCGSADANGTAGASIAAPTGPQAEGRGHWHGAPDPARMVERFDANHDGALQVAELPAPMQARLADADTDHDGTLAVTELTAHREAARQARFARIDTNGDGAVTADEAGERWARLNTADADHDGRVTRTELEGAFASGAMRGGHGPMGGDRGGMGGRHGPPDPAAMVQRFDANHDGVLQVAELPAPMQARIGGADADHDGALSVPELTVAIAQRRAAHEAREAQGQ